MIRRLPAFILIVSCALLTGCRTEPERTPEAFLEMFPDFALPAAGPENASALTLAEAIRCALANNPDYSAAAASVRAAKMEYYRTLAPYLPQVRFRTAIAAVHEWNTNRENPPAGIEAQERAFEPVGTVEAAWVLFDGLEREFTMLAARSQWRKSHAMNENARRLLIRAVIFAFCDVCLAERELEIGRADLDFQRSCLAQASARYEFGHIALDAVLNFRIRCALAESRLLEIRERRDNSRFALAATLGLPPGRTLPETLVFPDTIPAEKTDPAACIRIALQNRPDLTAAIRSLEAASWNKYGAWSGFLPTLSLYSAYTFGSRAARVHGTDFTRSYYNTNGLEYGITAAWDLFNGFDTVNRIRQNNVLWHIERDRLRARVLEIIRDVQSCRTAENTAAAQLDLARRIRGWTAEQRHLVAREYWAGHETINRLNGAQSELVAAENQFARAELELRKAEAALHTALGGFIRK